MLFTSFEFLIFFAIVFAIYYAPGLGRFQVAWLVGASLFFYAWNSPALLILLLLSISINAVASFKIAHTQPTEAKRWALGCVVANLLCLGFFKYGALITGLFVRAFSLPTPADSVLSLLMHLPLPIGISFYTFEGISLVADVTHQQRKGLTSSPGSLQVGRAGFKKHFLDTSLFVTFFPHLIAGPILKASAFLPQIGLKCFRAIRWADAIETLIIGYFLKVIVADHLRDYTYWIAHPYYETLSARTGLILLAGYSVQIFSDFAGYSLIAIGLGKLFGYELPANFNSPYISRSLSEFWRRWHISLSTWLRDYLYLPLGGNRKGNTRTYVNLMIVMALGGLWHGAALSYAIWGIYHGAGLALERFVVGRAWVKRLAERPCPSWLQVVGSGLAIMYVFSFVTLGWLLFKLPEWSHVVGFLLAMKANVLGRVDVYKAGPVLVLSLPVIIYHIAHGKVLQSHSEGVRRWALPLRSACAGIALVLVFLNNRASTEFIYFQF